MHTNKKVLIEMHAYIQDSKQIKRQKATFDITTIHFLVNSVVSNRFLVIRCPYRKNKCHGNKSLTVQEGGFSVSPVLAVSA